MKILANDGIDDSAKKILTDKGFVIHDQKIPQTDIASFIRQHNIEILIVRSATQVRKDLIEACPSLKVIARAGVGTDNIDVAYAKQKNITVMTTPSASSRSVAELVIAHIFSLSRFLHQAHREMPIKGNTDFAALKKNYSHGMELYGKTLGIIGMGRIGCLTAEYALRLGMNVLAHDPFVKEKNISFCIGTQTLNFSLLSQPLETILQQSDFVSLHVPMPTDGKPLIGKAELNRMKKSAFLINASRGGVVEEQALLEALNNRTIAGAGLDVFAGEPSPNPALLVHPRISASPHIGASTQEAQERIGIDLAEQIIAFFHL